MVVWCWQVKLRSNTSTSFSRVITTEMHSDSSDANKGATESKIFLNVPFIFQTIIERVSSIAKRKSNNDAQICFDDEGKREELLAHSKVFVTESSGEKQEGATTPVDGYPSKCFVHPVVGATLIGLPFALKQTGLPAGIAAIFLVAFASDHCVVMLAHHSIVGNKDSSQDYAESAFEKLGFLLLFILRSSFSLSTLMCYHVITGDCLTKVLSMVGQAFDFNISRSVVICASAWLLNFPLSLYRNGELLSKASLLSLILATATFILTVIRLFTLESHLVIIPLERVMKKTSVTVFCDKKPAKLYTFKFLRLSFLQGIGIISFVFLNHHSTYIVYHATELPTLATRWSGVSRIVSSYALLSSLILGISGYLTFKSISQGNILENYCDEDTFANAVRVCFTLFAVILYPVDCQGLAQMFQRTFLSGVKESNLLNVALSFVIVGLACSAALTIDCLSFILEVSGLLFAVPLVFLVPSAYMLRSWRNPVAACQSIPLLVLLTSGTAVMSYGFLLIMYGQRGCVHNSKYHPYCNGSSELIGPLITLMSLQKNPSKDYFLYNVSAIDLYNMTDIAAAYFV